jgi:disulfide bond formation protein DsbB
MLYSGKDIRRERFELSLGAAALILSGASFAAIASMWALEYAGYAPCPLCLDERIPHYAAIPGGLLAAYLAARAPRIAALIIAALTLGFIYDAGLSVYHAGAEWRFWPGPDTCTGDAVKPGNLMEALRHNKAVRCDEAALRIFGISLAGYGALLAAALATLGATALLKWRKPESR